MKTDSWDSNKIVPIPISLAISVVAISAVLLVTGVFMGLSTLVFQGSSADFPQTAASALFSTAMMDITTHLKKSVDIADEIQYITAAYNVSLPTEVASQYPETQGELNVSNYYVGPDYNMARINRTENISKILKTFEDRSTGSTFGLYRMLLLNSIKDAKHSLSSSAQIGYADGSVQAVSVGLDEKNTYMFLIPSRRIGRHRLPYNAVISERTPIHSGSFTSAALFVDKDCNLSQYNWYSNVELIPMSKQWGDLTLSYFPTISLGAPLFDINSRFIGVFNSVIGLGDLNRLLKTGYRHGTDQFILSDDVIVASSLADHWSRAFTEVKFQKNEPIPSMCARNRSTVYCLSTVESFDYPLLIEAVSAFPDIVIISSDDPLEMRNKPPTQFTMQSSIGTVLVGYNPIVPPFSMNMNWKLVTLLTNPEVTSSQSHVVGLMVGVCIGIVVVVVLALNFLIRAMMRPLTSISRGMTSSAYLQDVAAGGVEEKEPLDNSNFVSRTLSRWVEVRAIQKAYWAMSEELQALKAYIPEHLRDEVMAMHRAGKVDVNRKGNLTEADLLFSVVEKAEYHRRAGTDSSALSPDAHTCALSTIDPKNSNTDYIPMSDMGRLDDDMAISYTHDSFEDASVAAAKAAIPANNYEQPIFFADNVLVDRDITVVHINIVHFHYYARCHPGVTVSRDYQDYISFIHKEARRHGGILESFSGDKVWVSFNASSKCVNGPIAAAYFAHFVTSTVNNGVIHKARVAAQISTMNERCDEGIYFQIAPNGVTCGVATGRAFVGPLGNPAIKRHTIISNAMAEAAALERQALRYPGCNVLVGGDMIPAIEGYCQYLLMDTTLLPGSEGKRRRIACLKGPMIDPKCDIALVRDWLPPAGVASTANRFRTINEAMNAFLEGQYEVCRSYLVAAAHELEVQLLGETLYDREERKGSVFFILHLLNMLIEQGVDGRTFRSDYGAVHKPFQHPLCFSIVHPM